MSEHQSEAEAGGANTSQKYFLVSEAVGTCWGVP